MRHLHKVTRTAFEVRAGDINVWTRELACINVALQVQVGVSFHATGGAHGGDAASEVEAWRCEGHLRHQHRRVKASAGGEIGAGDIEEVVVHADDSRHDATTAKIENSCAVGGSYVRTFV